MNKLQMLTGIQTKIDTFEDRIEGSDSAEEIDKMREIVFFLKAEERRIANSIQ